MRKKPITVTVHDKMQRGYRYQLVEPEGRNFAPDFKPELTPKQMLALGIFAYGVRSEDGIVRWVGIAFVVAAFLLRFFKKTTPE